MSFAKRALENLPEFDEVVEVEPAFNAVEFMAKFQPNLTPGDLRQLWREGWLDDTKVGRKLFENGYSDWHCDNADQYDGYRRAQAQAYRITMSEWLTADMAQIAA